MLKVKTSVRISLIPNAGLGLFAEEFIAKDSIIWEFNPVIDRVYTQLEYNAMEGLLKKYVWTYSFKYLGNYYLCGDDARFFNHSTECNCYSSDFTENHLGYTRALVDIHPGDEITENYANFGSSQDDHNFNTHFL